MEEVSIIRVDEDSMTVSARELHNALEVKTPYDKWFPRMCEYGFAKGTDFSTKMSESTGGRPATDADISIDMAKEICMLQRTEKGKEVRRYFLDLEKKWNSPEQVYARAIKMADRTIASLKEQVNQISIQNSRLTVDNQVMQPKADYFDELVDRNLLTSFTNCAKELGIKRKTLIGFLLDHGYIYRDKRGNLIPRANSKADGLFEVKQCSATNGWAGCQTLITPKGVETFRLLCQGI